MSEENTAVLITLVASTATMLVLASFFVVLVYRYQKKMYAKQQEIFHTIIKAQEEERRIIARDIHDSLGGLLNSSKMLLAHHTGHFSEEQGGLAKDIGKVYDYLSRAIVETKNVSNALMPDTIKRFGLAGAINDLVKKFQDHFEIELMNNTQAALSEYTQINLYRLLSELLNNSAKHAHATFVEIEILERDNELLFHYSDNGEGFDFQSMVRLREGNGLKNIQQRIRLLNGSVETRNYMGSVYNMKFKIDKLP